MPKTVFDCGKIQIGDNVYLKKIIIDSDQSEEKVYIVVNEKDEIVSGCSTTYTIRLGKNISDYSNTTIVK
jgi:hypothetical protein